jgi:hypothetical protein
MHRKYSAIPILLVFLLAMIGLVYATWSQNLYINGTVNTGELDWRFTGASCLDTSGNDYHCRDGFTGEPQFWMGNKDVGGTSVKIIDPHTVNVTLTNVYPCYYTSVSVYAKNIGTIPLIIDSVIIDGHIFRTTQQPYAYVQLDLNGDHYYDIEIWWKNALGSQLHPGDYSDEMSFWLHILQGAPEGATLTFTIEVVAIQWNMYVKP